MLAARQEIADNVGPDAITDRKDELERHTSSSWSTYPVQDQDKPQFVVFPTSTDEVSKMVRICHNRAIPIVAFSAGTSLEGHFANIGCGICVNVSRMNKILTVHTDDLDAVVQPGMTYTELNEALASNGLFFPPDPGPGAIIGGMVGTGCSGTNVFHYGTMRDWAVSLTVVLADGTVVKTRQRPRKSSAGYDLNKLFIGSEGTLGIVTEAVVRITSLPTNERVAVVAFDTVQEAFRLVSNVVRSGIQVAAIELLGKNAMVLMNETANSDREWRESPTLFIKFAGSEKAVAEEMARVKDLAKVGGAKRIDVAKDEEEAEGLWMARKEALFQVRLLQFVLPLPVHCDWDNSEWYNNEWDDYEVENYSSKTRFFCSFKFHFKRHCSLSLTKLDRRQACAERQIRCGSQM
jgi:D-lactate dehydrogenase (cytochrome)